MRRDCCKKWCLWRSWGRLCGLKVGDCADGAISVIKTEELKGAREQEREGIEQTQGLQVKS